MWTRAVAVILITGMLASVAEAADKKKAAQTDAQKPASAASPATGGTAPPAKSAAEVAQEKLSEAWMTRIAGAWTLQLKPPAGVKAAAAKDTITFTGRRVESEALKQDGFGGSNFTLTPEDEHAAVWETMQIAPDGKRVLWRAEIHDDAMSGTMIKQPKEGESISWSFTGAKPAPVPAPAPAAAAPVAPAPATTAKPTTH